METELFKIEDGMIHVYGEQIHNSTQYYGALITEKEYNNYALRL